MKRKALHWSMQGGDPVAVIQRMIHAMKNYTGPRPSYILPDVAFGHWMRRMNRIGRARASKLLWKAITKRRPNVGYNRAR